MKQDMTELNEVEVAEQMAAIKDAVEISDLQLAMVGGGNAEPSCY